MGPFLRKGWTILSPFVSIKDGLEFINEEGKENFRLLKYLNNITFFLLLIAFVVFLIDIFL